MTQPVQQQFEKILIADVSRVENFQKAFEMMGRRRYMRKFGEQITKDHVKTIISELHRRRVVNFVRLPYIQRKIDDIWQSDLLDLVNLKSIENRRMRYVIVVIDCFRYLFYHCQHQQLNMTHFILFQ